MRRVLVKRLLLYFLLIVFIILLIQTHATYIPTNDAYTLVNYLNEQIGKSYTANRCQAFVYNSLANSLGVYGAKACAYEAWLDYGVSTDRDIPLGAAVYFSGGNYPCGNHIAGHVGLYIGDGYVVHVAQSKVQKTLVSSIESWSGYSYLGWGWQGGYALTKPIEPPSNVSLSANKTLYAVGETVTFLCSGTDVEGYAIGITKDGTRIFTGDIGSVYETTFSEPGDYAAYISAWNSAGSIDSQLIAFSVYDTKPSNAWMWKEKSEIAINEQIKFNYNATNATGFVLGIDKIGVGRIATIDVGNSDWYTTTFSETGTYTIYATCYNSLGGIDTNVETFTVYNPLPVNAWITADKSVVGVGEEITFTFNADRATGFTLGIDKTDVGRISTPNVGFSNTFTTSFDNPGIYSAYVTCFNSYGGCDSTRIEFIVYNDESLFAIKNRNSVRIIKELNVNFKNYACIIALYKNNKLMKMINESNLNGNTILDKTILCSEEYDEIKIIVVDSITNIKPLCKAEVIPSSEWIEE